MGHSTVYTVAASQDNPQNVIRSNDVEASENLSDPHVTG